MTERHTPGPWRVDGLLGPTVYNNDGRRVAACQPRETIEDSPIAWAVAKANARLIAEAPDLAQLVREALAEFEGNNDENDDYVIDVRDWIQTARRVLAAIHGQTRPEEP